MLSLPLQLKTKENPPQRYRRVVDQLTLHESPISFRALCEKTIPKDTQYIIFDLDKTMHLNRNIGELLGWELFALQAYGPEHLTKKVGKRKPGRLFIDWNRPFSALMMCLSALAQWGYAGLFYLGWVKIAAKAVWLKHKSFLRYGPEPVATVQELPQTVLMNHMAQFPLDTLRLMAQRVWNRHQCDQVISREDLQWLRSHCPGVKLIVSSASPQPVLEAAARQLGVDEIAFSHVEEFDGYLSAPAWLRPIFRQRAPRRISPPKKLWMNSNHTKIHHLQKRFPEMFVEGARTVGITDTSYGEDHCWANHFERVIDVNSTAPFSPVVAASSPILEIHSAQVLTNREEQKRLAGNETYLSPRRSGRQKRTFPTSHTFDFSMLSAQLSTALETIEELESQYHHQEIALLDSMEPVQRRINEVQNQIEAIVASYNSTVGLKRYWVLRQLKRQLSKYKILQRKLFKIQRPLSDLAFSITFLLETAGTSMSRPDTKNSGISLP